MVKRNDMDLLNRKQIMNWLCIVTLKILFFPLLLLWRGVITLFLTICAMGEGEEVDNGADFTLYYEDEEDE